MPRSITSVLSWTRAKGWKRAGRLACVLASVLLAQAAMATTVLYPRPETADDARTDYPLRLLQLALSKSHTAYTLQPSSIVMDQGRALAELGRPGGGISIVWSMTSRERETTLLPIRIPIYKGLISWRIPLVADSNRDLLKNVKTLEQLRALTAGQGHDWPDTDILRSNACWQTATSITFRARLRKSGPKRMHIARKT
jgi:hypothetical protein